MACLFWVPSSEVFVIVYALPVVINDCGLNRERPLHISEFDEESLTRLSTTLSQLKRRVITPQPGKGRAAVVVSLCTVDGKASVLFTHRTETVSTHKGQVSFPGGMSDPEDVDATATALRELEEEIGLPASQVRVLGIYHELHAITGVAVTSIIGFLGELGDLSDLVLAPDEIQQAFTLTLDELIDPETRHQVRYDPRGVYPVFEAGPAPVWGLTAYILGEVLEELLGFELWPPS